MSVSDQAPIASCLVGRDWCTCLGSILDFWLLDFATKQPRQITRLIDQGYLNTFDITPDGKSIVFDRTRENSDIVLIDRPKYDPARRNRPPRRTHG